MPARTVTRSEFQEELKQFENGYPGPGDLPLIYVIGIGLKRVMEALEAGETEGALWIAKHYSTTFEMNVDMPSLYEVERDTFEHAFVDPQDEARYDAIDRASLNEFDLDGDFSMGAEGKALVKKLVVLANKYDKAGNTKTADLIDRHLQELLRLKVQLKKPR